MLHEHQAIYPSFKVQLAIASLVATLFANLLGAGVGFARLDPQFAMLIAADGVIVAVGLFALPLVWWRRKLGYACAILVGAVNVLGNIGGIAGGTLAASPFPAAAGVIMGAQTLFSLPLIVSLVYAWREKA